MRLSLWCTSATLGLVLGCGGGPPRKPLPPDQRYRKGTVAREFFQIRGTRDEWHELPPIKQKLESMGGVLEVSRDKGTGKFVVVYNIRRTNRDKIRARIIEIGRELGQSFDPIFDDR